MNLAQTFTLLACLLSVATIVFAQVLRSAAVPATTAGKTVKLRSEPGVMAVLDVWANWRFAQQACPALAELPEHSGTSFISASRVRQPRPLSIQEGPSETSFSSTPLAQLDGHLLSS